MKINHVFMMATLEKGSVENRIGVIRRFFLKNTIISLVTKEQIKQVETKINSRPLKIFNFKTSLELYNKFAFIS